MENKGNLEKIHWPSMGKSGYAYDPAAHARMKADSLNETIGNLTGTDCPKCKNRGRIAYPKDDGTSDIYIEDCSCMTMRRCIWKMEESGLQDVVQEYTFDKFKAAATWQQQAKDTAKRYSCNPVGWFLACGQSGSGKTHLCTAICRELLLQGKKVVYMPWRQDVAEIKASSLDSDRRTERLENLKNAEYLYIDDLFKAGANPDGTIRPTSADISIAFEILNHRYINKRPTIISTELMPEALLDIDEATGGRIVERAKGNVLSISRDAGKNYRLQGILEL